MQTQTRVGHDIYSARVTDIHYPIALRAHSATVPEHKIGDTDDDVIFVFLGVHKAGALSMLH